MRVIDLWLGGEHAERVSEDAAECGHHVVALTDGDPRLIRVVCAVGDPDEFIESVRDRLRSESCGDEHYIVYEPAAFEPKPEEHEEDEGDEPVAGRDEIERFVAEGAQLTRTYIALSVLSGVIAAAGLLRESVAVVVGAMVLAPLFKPIALAGVSVVLGNPRRALRAVLWLVVSLALSAASAMLTALLTPDSTVTTLVELRTGTTPFDLVVAFAAGIAMAFVVVKRDSLAMVGIVVAASLMPVAAAMGVVAAVGAWDLMVGAAFTLSSNVCGILLGLILGLRVADLRATGGGEKSIAQTLTRRSIIAGGLVAAGLIGFGVYSYVGADKRTIEGPGTPPPGSRWVTPEEAERLGVGNDVVELRLVAPAAKVDGDSHRAAPPRKD